MDIDEWEYLPDHGYLDFNEVGENQIFFGKRNNNSETKTSTTTTPTTVFDMNYFCTSPKSKEEKAAPWNHHHQQRVPPAKRQQLVHVPIQLEPRIGLTPDGGLLVEQSTDKKDHVGVETEQKTTSVLEQPVDQDTVSQVFFKIKENNEFVDMKMDSPKSGSRGYLFPPLIDAGGAAMRFEDKGEALVTSPRMKIEKEMIMMDCDEKEEEEEEEEEGEKELFEDSSDGGNFNLWKWGLTGVGAIFSFGVAAATICVLFFGTHQRNKLQQDQKIRFQIYTDDKRLNQVVQHATKLNEAISAVRGVPLSRAHITYGGYYDGL